MECIFNLYCGTYLFCVFAEMLGRADVPVNYRYNLVPFKEIKDLSYITDK